MNLEFHLGLVIEYIMVKVGMTLLYFFAEETKELNPKMLK